MRLVELMPLLACPACFHSLCEKNARLECSNCHSAYALEDGIPILLTPESVKMLHATETAFERSLLAQEWQPRSAILGRLLTPPAATRNAAMPRIAEIFRQQLAPSARVLFIGGMRASDHVFFSDYCSISLDIAARTGLDIVGDGHRLPFLSGQLDGIVAQAVFEHVPAPELIIQHAWRALRPGGLIYVAVPFMQPYHFGPLDYRRYTLLELEGVMRDFEKIAAGVASGPGSTLAWLIRIYLSSFAEGAVAHRILDAAGGWLGFAFKYTDVFLVKKRRAELAACAYYYVGRKPHSATARTRQVE